MHAGYTSTARPRSSSSSTGRRRRRDAFAPSRTICESAAPGCGSRLGRRERAAIWRGRKAAFAAVGRISPDYFVQDGVVPARAWPRRSPGSAHWATSRAARGQRLPRRRRNLHPLVLYGAAAGELERAEELSKAIAELCVELGGSLSGEHGIGTDKACAMPTMFADDDLGAMLRCAAFDPAGISNPGKVFPTPRLCGERPGRYEPHPLEAAGVIERL